MNDPALYATGYDLQNHGCRYYAEEFADELRKMSGRCIDIGSGPGDALIEFILPKLSPRSTIVCSDISERMVDFAKETYGDNYRLSFTKLDIGTRNLPNDLIGQFNHVTSFYCLHWCQDMRQAFRNIFDLLQPGGTALVSFVSHTAVFDGYEELTAIPRYKPYMKDSSRFVPVYQNSKRPCEALKKILKEVGFDIRHLSERQMIHIFNTKDALSNFVVSLNPFIERMPADLREEYEEDLVNDFVKRDTVFRTHITENDYRTVQIYRTIIVHLKKPSSN